MILKAPIATPQGKGYKSLNVTLRKSLGLFSNVHPYVETHYPDMDVVIIRENEKYLYAGIEHQQTQDVVQCIKLFTCPGCEKIVRYAFEYAKAYNRKKITCMAGSANIGLNVAMFEAIHGSAPDITGKKIANPSGLMNVSVMMLSHLGMTDMVDKVKNAWLFAIEDGCHTADIYKEGISKKLVNTVKFTDAVIERLGKVPTNLPVNQLSKGVGKIVIPPFVRKEKKQELIFGLFL